MPNLERGTELFRDECPQCEKQIVIKINSAGKAYYNCLYPRTDTGNMCGCGFKWGRDDSQKMQREYLERRAANNNRKPKVKEDAKTAKIHEPANENSEPQQPAKRVRDAGKAFYES
tara:strand:- start:2783 stop:3130 length:348 start_codon:yes stop_codon:yes gene_type:complete